MIQMGEHLTTPPTLTDKGYGNIQLDKKANLLVVPPQYVKTVPVVADAAIVTGAGVLHTLIINTQDGTPVAGSFIIYDNTAASGRILYQEGNGTGTFRGYSILLDCAFSNGIYVDFFTVTDVQVAVTYLTY